MNGTMTRPRTRGTAVTAAPAVRVRRISRSLLGLCFGLLALIFFLPMIWMTLSG
ncbi:hypothetical protein [Actinomadura graeca]|uniref:hypothetical protein n=1 Tax=Actinomadura graeca TaxID=2750812 RepID=UPI001E46B43D|nr:hypothetical protein [Actinomadura graeca]